MRSRGLWLLVGGVLLGLLGLAALTAVAKAGTSDKTAGMSVALPAAFPGVVEAVRAVCADGVIRGTSQYASEPAIDGAHNAVSSPLFPPWTGAGQVFYKTRPGAIAPSHFSGSRDRGELTVRYLVQPAHDGQTLVTISAVFVEDTGHGRHLSQGSVERAEFGEIGKLLKSSGALVDEPVSPTPSPERESLKVAKAAPRPAPPSPAPQERTTPLSRTYRVAENDVKRALEELGAFDDAPLPALEGFAALASDRLARYDRPYYRFRVDFEPAGAGRTTVHIEAVVTARYSDAPQSRLEYRTVPSNGRLETDLFDRLDGRLRVAAGIPASGAEGFRP